jgi:hypothetical protein
MRQMIVLLAVMAASVFSDHRCIMSFSDCPETFKGQTILVPEDVIGLSPSILACKDSTVNSISATPSILFIIDNSSSMYNTNDKTGARYNVTRDILDSITTKWPKAEVGLVIFSGTLIFDTTTSSTYYYTKYFKAISTAFDSTPSQAYLPFLTLNQNYDGRTGRSILSDALKTKTVNNKVLLNYTPSAFSANSGTNINIGFLAAREAFKNARNPANQQYIIFLSDGGSNTTSGSYPTDYYQDSTRGIPMTYTVFFPAGQVPTSLQTMTNSIKNNNYSATNPQSGITSINASYQNLLTILMNNVINKIVFQSVPYKLMINTVSSTTYINEHFIFPDTFDLVTGANQFVMKVTYRTTNPSTGLPADTTKQFDFSVQRSPGVTNPPAGIDLACAEIDSLRIVAGSNNTLLQSLSMRIGAKDTTLKVQHKRADNGQWESIEANWSIVPGLTMSKQPQGSFWTFAPIDTGSGIIVVSKQGLVPDTLAVHFLPILGAIPVTAILLDNNGDGHLDRVDLVVHSDTASLSATLPKVNDLIVSMNIVSTDNGAPVTLVAGSMSLEGVHTIHVTLTENTGSTMETGWTSADIKLSNIGMTDNGRSIFVDSIVDGADPVIKSACFSPADNADTLRVMYSEPVITTANDTLIGPNNAKKPLSSASVIKDKNMVLFIVPPSTFTGTDTVKSNSRKFFVNPCEDGPIVATVRAIGNPFKPGASINYIPSMQRSVGEPIYGIRIEVVFIKVLELNLKSGNLTGAFSIFDAVGNTIINKNPMKIDLKNVEKNAKLYWIWDGTTKNGARVAPGTYLARILVEDHKNGRKLSFPLNLGIKQ